MLTYLGVPGQMVTLGCPARLESEVEREYDIQTTLGGFDQVHWSPVQGPRTWTVDMSKVTRSQDVAGVRSLLAGAYGPPPWAFISPEMAVTNLMPERASMFAPGTWQGTGMALGAFHAADGTVHPTSLFAQTGNVYFGMDSIIVAGQPVTASVYATAGTKFHLHLRDTTGNILTNLNTVARVDGGRVSISTVAPEGAAVARLAVAASAGPGTVAGPSVTLTEGPVGYAWGDGCDSALVAGISTSVAYIDPVRGVLGARSLTVREIRR